MRTWGDARRRAVARLRSGADRSTAGLDADVLLAFSLNVSKAELLAHPERPLSGEADERFALLVERRHGGEPVAYIRGFKEFYGQPFRVDRRVLIPRPETETLVEAALRFIATLPERQVTVIDVGTGSGAIACSIALHALRSRVIGIDASRDALDLAEVNARSLGVAARVSFIEGDLLGPINERAEVVCANLPYLREDALAHLVGERSSLAFEPRLAVVAGPDGLGLIRRAAADLPRVLAPRGAAFFECDPAQAANVAELLQAAGLRTHVLSDLMGSERVVAGTSSG